MNDRDPTSGGERMTAKPMTAQRMTFVRQRSAMEPERQHYKHSEYTMYLIDPDIGLIEYLRKDCKSALSTCMQCGSCSAVCELSPQEKPFPRKEVIWAAWGLRDKLLGDPDIWLCHQCGDCTTTCPRNIRPGDVIASLRNFSYLHYARPGFLGRWMQNPKYLPLVIAIPVITIAAILFLVGNSGIPGGPVDYSRFFPHAWLNSSFFILVLVLAGFLVSALAKFIRDLRHQMPSTGSQISLQKSFLLVMGDILSHRKFRTCGTNRFRFLAHFLVFWGFVLLLLVTLFAIFAVLISSYPLNFAHPVKIMGNVAGVMLLTGTGIMIWKRLGTGNGKGKSRFFDWSFLIILFFLTLSGGLVEVARFQNWSVAYLLYFLHLVLVWMLILYAPYTKFGHFIFRTIALLYCKMKGR